MKHNFIGNLMSFHGCVSKVWAAIPPWKQGSLAEFVVLSANEVLFNACSTNTILCLTLYINASFFKSKYYTFISFVFI